MTNDSTMGPAPSFESPLDPLNPSSSPGGAPPQLWGQPATKGKKERPILVELLMVGLLALLLALVLRVFVTQVYAISGHSMEPTLRDGQMVMIHKLSPAITDVGRGDLVIFESPRHARKDLIKRVIALAGDKVCIKGNQVWVNGQALAENYIRRSISPKAFKEKVVPEGMIFVLGDNRPQSQDSRDFGFVDLTKVKGEVFMRLWPIRELSTFP